MTNINKGISLALATALISGFSVFLNKFAVGFWASSSAYTTAKNIVVAILLIGLFLFWRKISEFKFLSKKDWLRLVVIGFIGGSIPFLLFFKALSLIPSSNAAFIHKTLFIWVALLALPILKEKLSKLQILALLILVISVFMITVPKLQFGNGEALVLLATLFWAVENVFAKVVLKKLSSFIVAWGRMFFGSLFLVIYLIAVGQVGQLLPASFSQAGWLLLCGFVLFGYVITWYAALKFAPATLVSTILVMAVPITIALNSIFVTKILPLKAMPPGILIVLGVVIFSYVYGRSFKMPALRFWSK